MYIRVCYVHIHYCMQHFLFAFHVSQAALAYIIPMRGSLSSINARWIIFIVKAMVENMRERGKKGGQGHATALYSTPQDLGNVLKPLYDPNKPCISLLRHLWDKFGWGWWSQFPLSSLLSSSSPPTLSKQQGIVLHTPLSIFPATRQQVRVDVKKEKICPRDQHPCILDWSQNAIERAHKEKYWQKWGLLKTQPCF